jgi:hypothetical protein
MKGYIVRNSQQTIFVKSIATEEEIEFIKEKYGKLGWLILPCKNEGKKPVKAEAHENIDKDFNIPYDKVNKADIEIFVSKNLDRNML